jgi:hypothetical protein
VGIRYFKRYKTLKIINFRKKHKNPVKSVIHVEPIEHGSDDYWDDEIERLTRKLWRAEFISLAKFAVLVVLTFILGALAIATPVLTNRFLIFWFGL